MPTIASSSAPPRLHAPRLPTEKPDISIPQARRIAVDTTGAQIVQEESPATRDSRGIYLPHYIEPVSHIAIDIGGSLAKIVYFTRSSNPITHTPEHSVPSSPFLPPSQSVSSPPNGNNHLPDSPTDTFELKRPIHNGALTPQRLVQDYLTAAPRSSQSRASRASISTHPKLRRSSVPAPLPGGVLNFTRFETSNIDDLIQWLSDLIKSSAEANRVSLEKMRSTVKVMVTGGGAYLFNDKLANELGVEVTREEEMASLILGLGFVARIPEEVFWFSEELINKVSHPSPPDEESREIQNGSSPSDNTSSSDPSASPSSQNTIPTQTSKATTSQTRASQQTLKPSLIPQPDLERPSPTPPQYQVEFAPPLSEDGSEGEPNFPCLVVNIGSGVSIVKVDEDGQFERVSGTSLGGATLWGLLSLLTDARSFDEMLLLSEKGDNTTVDMLVGDIYGSDYSKIGLKSSTIASTFGKVFKKGQTADERKKGIRQEDVARSLLYAVSNNIGHVAYMNAAKYGLDRVFFSGCFIRGHAATISTLSYAIRFWSKGTMRACFLRHEGFLGAIGAWIRNVEPSTREDQAGGEDEDLKNGIISPVQSL